MAERMSFRRPISIAIVSLVSTAAVLLARFSYTHRGDDYVVDAAISVILSLYAIVTGYLGWHMTRECP